MSPGPWGGTSGGALQDHNGLPDSNAQSGGVDDPTSATAIARGEVGNAISGTIEVPVNLRSLTRFNPGKMPVTLHAFDVTGPLIRSARISLFWRDDHAISYVVDGVPPDYPIVLAATIEPGVVLRVIVPTSSPEAPARGQRIDARSESIVLKSSLMGVIPPVGLGGIAEVVRQGGLDPGSAADENDKAAAELSKLRMTPWGSSEPALGALVSALEDLTQAQREAAPLLGAAKGRIVPTRVFQASTKVTEALTNLIVRERTHSNPTPITEGEKRQLASALAHLRRADTTDVPAPTTIVSVPGTFNLAQLSTTPTTFLYGGERSASRKNLEELYKKAGAFSTANTEFANPNGQPFSAMEIARAFASGRGPYRTECPPINFLGVTNCRVVVNPFDDAQEFLITREANYLNKVLLRLEEATTERDVALLLTEHPAFTNFIFDDTSRWKTPVGTWRLRLKQDMGTDLSGKYGFMVISDSEMFIAPAGKKQAFDDDDQLPSDFLGTASIWMPDQFSFGEDGPGSEHLNNFGLRFSWDEETRTMSEGAIRGERRETEDGRVRTNYAAQFDADMVSSTRILGFWYNETSGIAGRFELIRGLASFEI